MTHQILSGMSSHCLFCGGEAHPTHLIGERDFYCKEHCPSCRPRDLLEPGGAKEAGVQQVLFEGGEN